MWIAFFSFLWFYTNLKRSHISVAICRSVCLSVRLSELKLYKIQTWNLQLICIHSPQNQKLYWNLNRLIIFWKAEFIDGPKKKCFIMDFVWDFPLCYKNLFLNLYQLKVMIWDSPNYQFYAVFWPNQSEKSILIKIQKIIWISFILYL